MSAEGAVKGAWKAPFPIVGTGQNGDARRMRVSPGCGWMKARA
jgi:hypothetical protein